MTDQQDQGSPLEALTESEETKEGLVLEITDENEMISITEICRLCANQSDRLLAIFSEDGETHELASKINLYLPITVSESDELPQQCCWSCASTLLAWHELVVAAVEANKRLQSCQFVTVNKTLNVVGDYIEDCDDTKLEEGLDNNRIDAEPVSTSLNAFCQTEELSELATGDDGSMELKQEVNTLTVYCTESNSPAVDSFENYITGLDHQFIVESPLEQNANLIALNCEAILTETDGLKQEDDNKKEVKDFEKEIPVSNLNFNFKCQYCSALYINKDDIINHIKTEHQDEPAPVSRAVKKKVVKKVKKEKLKLKKLDPDVINEAKVIVDDRVYYNCKQCGKSLHSPYTFSWHTRIHTGERPFVCDLCGKRFRVSQGLIRHVRETHERIKNFSCDICGRNFATKRNVDEHRRIHTNERPYICDLCGKAFKQKASLFVHNRSHNDSFPFKCNYCSQRFRTKPPLLLHVTRHTGEKPYPCEVCGRQFRIKYELKRHRLIHSDEKPFSCTTCGLSFRQKRYLRNHNKLNHAADQTA